MAENNNENQNTYTGEYGNSVEGGIPPQNSTYSYSYREGDNSVTHSGDYYAGRDATNSTPHVEEKKEDNTISESTNINYNNRYNSPNQGGQPFYNNVGSNNADGSGVNNNGKKKVGTGKKLFITAACAVLFGVVAAVCFEGVCYVSETVLGLNSRVEKQIGTTADSEKVTTSKSDAAASKVLGNTANVAGVVERTMPAMVAITSTTKGTDYYDLFGQYYQGQESIGSGSGFIVGQNDKELLIATNNHVIDGAKTISVRFVDDEVYEASVKGTDQSNDLAVIAVEVKTVKSSTMDEIKIADLGSSDDLKLGEMAIAIGNSLGYGQSVTVGYISAKDREITETSASSGKVTNRIKAIQTDAAINPGNSGGALLNTKGQVIGINSAKIADSSVEGVGYAIPISVAIPIIDELMNRENLSDAEKGYLGISGRTVTAEASSYNIPNGVYVVEVSKGGAADKAGIKSGDIITSINNMEVTTIESLQQKANSYRKGTKVEIIILRSNDGDYQEKKVEVTLQGKASLDGLSDGASSGSTDGNNYGSNDGYGNNDGYDDDSDGFGGFFSNPFFN